MLSDKVARELELEKVIYGLKFSLDYLWEKSYLYEDRTFQRHQEFALRITSEF